MSCEFDSYILLVVKLTFDSFEMLAFKSDVSHWREKKELTGVSVRYGCSLDKSSVLGLMLIDVLS